MHVLHDRDLAGCRQIIQTDFLLFERRYTKTMVKHDQALNIVKKKHIMY